MAIIKNVLLSPINVVLQHKLKTQNILSVVKLNSYSVICSRISLYTVHIYYIDRQRNNKFTISSLPLPTDQSDPNQGSLLRQSSNRGTSGGFTSYKPSPTQWALNGQIRSKIADVAWLDIFCRCFSIVNILRTSQMSSTNSFWDFKVDFVFLRHI